MNAQCLCVNRLMVGVYHFTYRVLGRTGRDYRSLGFRLPSIIALLQALS
jgi:hypothetical protein